MLRISFPFRYFRDNKISITIRIRIKMILPLWELTNIVISVYVNILHTKSNLVSKIDFIYQISYSANGPEIHKKD